jgi:hypothetical protein
MKHIITLFVLLLILTTCKHSFAQWGYGKPEDIAAIKSRTLIVVLEVPDQQIIDKLIKKNKSEYIDNYRKAVDDYNDYMKDAIDKFWTFSEKIEYKTDAQVEGLIKSKSKDYTVLRCVTTWSDFYRITAQAGLYWSYTKQTNNMLAENDFGWRNSSILEISLIEKEDKYYPIYFEGLQDIFPVESDIVYALRNLQWYLIQRENKASGGEMKDMIKANTPQLKNKILIVRKDIVDTDLTIETIKSVYPYQFEIDDSATFEQHIINADGGYAVLEVIPTYNGSVSVPRVDYIYYVMDTKNGNCLGSVMPSAGASTLATAELHSSLNSNGFNNSMGSPVADKRIFKNLAEQVVGK